MKILWKARLLSICCLKNQEREEERVVELN